MERTMLNENDLEGIFGGSIIFSEDGTTCGRNCNNQYKVLNFDAILKYYRENKGKMPEKQMMSNMVAMGYIAPI